MLVWTCASRSTGNGTMPGSSMTDNHSPARNGGSSLSAWDEAGTRSGGLTNQPLEPIKREKGLHRDKSPGPAALAAQQNVDNSA